MYEGGIVQRGGLYKGVSVSIQRGIVIITLINLRDFDIPKPESPELRGMFFRQKSPNGTAFSPDSSALTPNSKAILSTQSSLFAMQSGTFESLVSRLEGESQWAVIS